MAVIGINYEGGNTYNDNGDLLENPIIYESVYLHTKDGDFEYKSGDFIKDWFNAKKKYVLDLSEKEPFLSQSSSVDHFIMDGAKFDSCYLVTDKDEAFLDYENHEGWEFFVEPGTQPTWEELKKMCKE